MHRASTTYFQCQILRKMHQTQLQNRVIKPCDVFINHRGIDTKRTVATLLYDQFLRLNVYPFLDNKNMKPGDKLFEKISSAIRNCKVAVVVFSPNYCDSHFCLHELALIMEMKKKVIPIFCDINPLQLHVVDDGKCSKKEIRRFNWALEEAKYTVGLTFDSLNGNWSDFVTSAAEIVINSLNELEIEEQQWLHEAYHCPNCNEATTISMKDEIAMHRRTSSSLLEFGDPNSILVRLEKLEELLRKLRTKLKIYLNQLGF